MTVRARDAVDLLERARLTNDRAGLERIRFKHRRHDGSWSPAMERFVTGTGRRAVCVLAWDPFTRALVLVEQFRIGRPKP